MCCPFWGPLGRGRWGEGLCSAKDKRGLPGLFCPQLAVLPPSMLGHWCHQLYSGVAELRAVLVCRVPAALCTLPRAVAALSRQRKARLLFPRL